MKLLRCKNCFPASHSHQKNLYVKTCKVFVCPPKEANTNKIWKLRKCIYGLADASQYWYLEFREELIKLGAKPSQLDQGVFIWSINNKPVEYAWMWYALLMMSYGKVIKTLLILQTNWNKLSTLVQSIVKHSITLAYI